MGAKNLLTAAVLAAMIAILVAFYLRWAVQKLAGYHPDYFVCYWVALVGCLANLFLPFVYPMLMTSYRKLPDWAEVILLNFLGFLIFLFLYVLWIRSPEGRKLSWSKAALIAGVQYAFFMMLSIWI